MNQKLTQIKIASLWVLLFFYGINIYAQSTTLQGTVVDSRTGDPLIGATIIVEGTTQGALSDLDGNFKISVASLPVSINTNLVGYLTNTIIVYDDSEPIEIQLTEDLLKLSEVVVVGYGTQKRSNLTASLASVSADKLQGISKNSVDNMLEGLAAGVMVSTPGSQVGQAPIINIRGVASISSSSQPLYVVDGIPVNNSDIASNTDYNPIADINPADIKSIDVLKDAAATALYGSRAAAGVILITTNSGAGQTKSKITYDYNFGLSKAINLFEPMNAEQYTDIKNEGWLNNGGDPNNLPYATMTDKNGEIVNTNWVDLIFRTGATHNHNLNFQGSNDKFTYYISTGLTKQEGITIDASYDRFTFRANTTYEVNKYINLGFNSSYAWSKIRTSDSSRGGSLSSIGGLTRLAYVDLPNVPAYNEDGSFYASEVSPGNLGKGNNSVEVFYYNVLAVAKGGHYNESKTNRILASPYAEIKPLKGLTLKTQYGIDWTIVQNESFSPPVKGSGTYSNGGSSSVGTTSLKTWTWTNTADYKLTIEKNNINVLLGVEASESERHGWTRTGTQLSDADIAYVEANYITYGGSGNISESSLFSYISRLTYDYDGKYLFTANWRRDGLSKLGKKWGNFWGLSAAWRLSDENFFKPLRSFIDDFKVKASYGIVGNANVGWYASKTTYGTSTFNGQTSYNSSGVNDPNLGWEQTGTTDVGFTAALFKHRLSVDVDFFKSKSKDLILDSSQAYSTGIVGASISTNLGKVENKGIEIGLNAAIINKKRFKWNSTFNISFVKNKVIELDDDIVSLSSIKANITTEGYSMGQLYVYPTAGVDPQTGRRIAKIKQADGSYVNQLLIYKNGNGGIGLYDMDGETKSVYSLSDWKPEIAGNTKPTVYGGWNNTFKFLGFDASVNFHFSGGNKVLNAMKATLSDGRMWSGTENYYKKVWRKPGDKSDFAKTSYNDSYSNGTSYLNSDLIENGTFVRLQSASVGYTFDTKKWPSALGISSLRVYAQAHNIFTITSYSGFDPEINSHAESSNLNTGIDLNTTPLSRTFTIGATLSL